MSRRERTWTPGTPCWADLATADADGAADFYGAVLGWRVESSGPEYGGYRLAMLDGATAAGIGPAMSPDQPTGWTLYFATDDAAATARAVAGAGGRVLLGPMPIPGRGTMLTFADPVGVVAGVWQADPFIGAEVVNEPGALVWEDLRSPDSDASRRFLSAVFGHTHESFDGAPGDYTLLQLGEPFPIGGVGPLFGAARPQWVVYFAVADVDAAVATATAHGGTLLGGVDDTPYGRMAQLTDPAGAMLALIENTGQPQPDRT